MTDIFAKLIQTISVVAIPAILAVVLIAGIVKKVKIYDIQ